jgi:hypothetical protein
MKRDGAGRGNWELPLMNFLPSELSALVLYPVGYLYAAW